MSHAMIVYGIPAPQGSKTRMPNGAMVEASSATGRAKLVNWRSACADAAARHAKVTSTETGPLEITVEFRFPMPTSRKKATKEARVAWKVGKPDLDKLCRALGDSLAAGGLIARDELIVSWIATKVEVWEQWTGAIVQLRRMELVTP